MTGQPELYDNRMGHVGPFSYFEEDEPHWPGGDPGMAANNPLPPKVRRWGNYGVPAPAVVLALIILWCLVLVPYLPYLLSDESRRVGFDVKTLPGKGDEADYVGSGRRDVD